MNWLFSLIFLCLASSAHATCGDAYYNSTRAARISAIVASAPSSGAVFVAGDSHNDRGYSVTYAQGSQQIDGAPVYFLGSSGATWQTIRDCFPWAAIAAKSPSRVYLQASVNDTTTGQCCNGSGNGTATYARTIMQAIVNAQAAVASPIVLTDPPPESAAGIAAYANHQSARVVYYVATFCGGTCTWATFGWAGAVPTTPFQFIDLYRLMAGSSCSASSVAYATPCYAAAGSTLDNVHFPNDGVASMFGFLSAQ